jgi:hypothetical protein
MLMHSADWDHWASVFRYGADRGNQDDMSAPGKQVAAILDAMAEMCQMHARDARAGGL